MTNVVPFPGKTWVKLEPKRILENIVSSNPDAIIVIGLKDGQNELYGSMAELETIVYWLEKAKHDIISGRYDY